MSEREKRRLLVVTADLAPGAPLSREVLSVAEVPISYVDTRRVAADDLKDVIGVRLTGKLEAGQSLLYSDLDTGGRPLALAERLPKGRRAYPISESSNPLLGLVRPGDRVDVLQQKGEAVETLLQDIEVLSVGGALPADGASAESDQGGGLELGRRASGGFGVTLDVSSRQAEELFQAEAKGRLRLSLRHPDDHSLTVEDAEVSAAGKSTRTSPGRTTLPEIEHVQ